MPTELQKLAKAVAEIKRTQPARGKRYSTVVENPFESGYWPPVKATKRMTSRLRKNQATTMAGAPR